MSRKPLAVLTAHNAFIRQFLQHLGCDTVVWGTPQHTEEPDILVFTDGPNVTPIQYGHRLHPGLLNGKYQFSIRRDQRERRIFNSYSSFVPRFGFGRGALMLNVLNNGTLIQHVDNHDTSHSVLFHSTKQTMDSCPSNHSQMMKPSLVNDATIIASTDVSRCWKNEDGVTDVSKNDYRDPEIIFYENSNSLCWQPPVYTMDSYPLKGVLLSNLDQLINTGSLS